MSKDSSRSSSIERIQSTTQQVEAQHSEIFLNGNPLNLNIPSKTHLVQQQQQHQHSQQQQAAASNLLQHAQNILGAQTVSGLHSQTSPKVNLSNVHFLEQRSTPPRSLFLSPARGPTAFMAPNFAVLASGSSAGGANFIVESSKKTSAQVSSAGGFSNNLLFLETMSKDYKLADNIEVQRLIKIISEQREEIESWRTKCSHLESHMAHFRGGENRVKELEGRVSILLAENQKMNSLINEKILEIEAWRSKYAKLEISITEFRGLEARNRDLESRINLLLNELEQWKQKYYDLEGERHHFERSKRSAAQDKDFFENELKKLREVLEVRSKECEEW